MSEKVEDVNLVIKRLLSAGAKTSKEIKEVVIRKTGYLTAFTTPIWKSS